MNGPKSQLALIMRSLGAVTEFRFHGKRLWRFDHALPDLKIAVEYNGHHTTGRSFRQKATSGHSSITGITRDAEKINHAAEDGWIVLIFTALHFQMESRREHNLRSPIDTIRAVIAAREAYFSKLAE